MPSKEQIRPSAWYCAIGVVVILVGIALFVYELYDGIGQATDGLTQFLVPGQNVMSLTAKTNYTIFLEEQSEFDGRVYVTTEGVKGLECTIVPRFPATRSLCAVRP